MSDETRPPEPPEAALLRSATPSDEVIAARAEATRRDAALTERFAPGIDAHLATYGMAFDALEELHQQIADGTDLDLVSDTRPAAVWQMAGRCISLARGVLVLLRAGFTAEAVVLTRTLHEADRLPDVLADDQEEGLRAREPPRRSRESS